MTRGELLGITRLQRFSESIREPCGDGPTRGTFPISRLRGDTDAFYGEILNNSSAAWESGPAGRI